ncbi:MAG: lactonase family protein [Bacteroidales bacterium]|nr:lactonase family protein [Bacteroidales bacterium]
MKFNDKVRRFLAALVAGIVVLGCTRPVQILVGTYTENTTAEGIYLYSFNPRSAEARLLGVAPSGNPSFVILSPDKARAYAVNEFNDGRQGVSSFALGANSIAPINSVPIPSDLVPGEDPCNILLSGKTVLTSNYTGGSVTAFPIGDDGSLGGMSQSYVPENEAEPAHMHCAVESPDRRYIFVTNLGMDCIHRFAKTEGEKPLGPCETAWKNQDSIQYGPRHMVFSADGRFAYLLCELGDKLVVFSYDDGRLSPVQTLTAYDGDGHGSADIHLSPDGRYLYTSHRLKEDGIAIFAVEPSSGTVEKRGFQPTGRHPRNFAISPDGRYLLCACRDDNAIEIYSVDKATGALAPTGKAIAVGAPVCVQFITKNW